MNFIFVCATERDAPQFWGGARLAKSPVLYTGPPAAFHGIFANRLGLGIVYNRALKLYESVPNAILVFVHDDVTIEDANILRKLEESEYDVIGLAGATELDMTPPVLWHKNHPPQKSGAVAHTDGRDIWMASYGTFRKSCAVLDGLFLAVRLEAVVKAGIRFDEQFDFHFYDLDFTLQCSKAGLKVGTEPIWVVHAGLGEFNNDGWMANQSRFLAKWGGAGA